MVSELLNKYVWLIDTIRSYGEEGISLIDLQNRWQRYFDCDYARRSFNNHRTAISDIFGIDIECHRSTNTYYISGGKGAMDKEKAWLLDTFTVNSLLTEGKKALKNRVSVEEVPSGHKYLTDIMNSMLENKQLEISYKKYEKSESETLHVLPYALKEGGRRWYLVGYCNERGDNRIYALDRIKSLNFTKDKFKMPSNYNVEDEFYYSFGNYIPKKGEKPVTIRLKTTSHEANYLRDLPLHSNQVELKPDGEAHFFSFKVIPNDKLVMELCKYGTGVEVLEPKEIRDRVIDMHKSALAMYKHKK